MTDPHYKALLIGNGAFDRDPHKLSLLKGPANDLQVMREALTHPEFGLFDARNVHHMLDATNTEILEATEQFFNEAGPDDHLVLYYSGHGYPDTNNNLYLCARNTRTNLLTSSAIPDTTINQMAENSRARKFIFILDCCHSGGFKGGTAGLQLAHGSGRCLITSCASDQLSSDAVDQTGVSTFTHFLAQALTSGDVDADGDGIVLTSEVFKFVQPRVYNATKQTVQWTMDKTFGEAALARSKRRQPVIDAPATNTQILPTAPPLPATTGRPVLEISESRIEFREVQPGETLPTERIDVFNSGEGSLDWVVECEENWISIERHEDHLLLSLDTAEAGLRRGNVFIRDRGRGGSRTVRVLLDVAEPASPSIVASPDKVYFGNITRGSGAKIEVRISNAGPGNLQWQMDPAPDELVVCRHAKGFTVEIAPRFLGQISARMRVSSNGGDVEIPVQGFVMPPLPGGRQPSSPAREDVGLANSLLGWWSSDAGAMLVKQEGGGIAYTAHSVLGIKIGQGRFHPEGSIARFEGTNELTGPCTGQVSVRGNLLSGALTTAAGQSMPVMFVRKKPWFSSFVG